MNCLRGPPLPEPRWGELKPYLILTSEEHQRLVERAEEVLRDLLQTENYDSVDSLLCFYEAYKREDTCLFNVFKSYMPRIINKRLTCVGLALELINKWHELDEEFPDFANYSHIVSCEQDIVDFEAYVSAVGPYTLPKVDKEHALVCVLIEIDDIPGVLLADPGYHLSRVVTVMMHGVTPQTGWFTQLDLPKCQKEFCYKFNIPNFNFVEWREKKTKNDQSFYETSLIYVGRPYLDGINVTIRRNLVYEFRSILARNECGFLLGGVYFKILPMDNQFTLFRDDGTRKLKTIHKFNLFEDDKVIPEPLLVQLAEVNTILKFEEGELVATLRKVAMMLKDRSFVEQMTAINEYIQNYTRKEINTEYLHHNGDINYGEFQLHGYDDESD